MGLVADLLLAINAHKIRLTRDVTPPPFAKHYMRQITLAVGGESYTFQVDDEFEDVSTASPEMLLNMILMECTWYAEEEDYLTWCTSKGLDAASFTVREYYLQLGSLIQNLKATIGTLPHTSNFDWQLNAGDAQLLRKLGQKSA